MSSTTMHMNPGLPIMKSDNLVNWKLVNYAYSTLTDSPEMKLEEGLNSYGRGSWASSLRYVDGVYYVSTFANNTNKTYIYQTRDIENGPWTVSELPKLYHDASLFFEDGRVFLVYGHGDIRIIELTPDASAVKPGGLDQLLIPDASSIAGDDIMLKAEGSHIQKIDDRYYISLITWPRGGMRTQLVYRAEHLTGPYEGRVVLQHKGIAQGGFIDTPDGDWYAFLFKDNGAVGRIPYLVPVTWRNGWPVLGEDGNVPQNLGFNVENSSLGRLVTSGIVTSGIVTSGIVTSDEFDTSEQPASLGLEWQWNHNPDNSAWSLTDRPGYLRLTNTRLDNDFLTTRNTLTQRTFGPRGSARVALDITNMKAGDVAGLGALQANYGYIGVRRNDNNHSLIVVEGNPDKSLELASLPVDQNKIYLKIETDFRDRIDQAHFFYSLDGTAWKQIGGTLQMSYTLPHFMGYRFALFNYATEATGGYVDFDYYRLESF